MPPRARDHVITDADYPTSAIARWDANIAAIRLSKKLEAENRPATPAEQNVLAKYSGFGDSQFNQAFQYAYDDAWKRRKEELEDVVTDEELKGIRLSRLNAFYTTPGIVRSMWGTLSKMGADRLERPKVLEPSAGSGRFLGLQPQKMAERSERTAVELDPMTAKILKPLYPESKVYQSGFEEAPLPDDHYDIAISNVPFGDIKVYDKDFNATGRKYLTNSVHNYFFAKTLDKLRPGGVMAYITSHHTMDSQKAEPIRRYLADRADLVGAVRLPEDAFPDTQVVTDIVYLRKREEGAEPEDDSWVKTEPTTVGRDWRGPVTENVNRYYIDNPDRVLGSHSNEGSMYRGGSYTVKSDPDRPVETALDQEHAEIVSENRPIRAATPAPARTQAQLSTGPGREQPPQYVLVDGKLRVSRGAETIDHDLPEKTAARVSDLIELKDTARRLVDQESTDTDSETVEATRRSLLALYDEYVDTHGESVNTPANRKLLGNAADDHLLFALEHYDPESECWKAADIMERRVIGAVPSKRVNTPADAMQVTLNESGKLDFDRMGELLDRGPDEIRDELAADKLVFKSPKGESWIPASEYLTGNVREKLKTAEVAAQADPAFRGHVEALREAQPPWVSAEDIRTPLGAPWIPASVVNEWVKHEFDLPTYYSGNKTGQYFRHLGETESFIGENEKGSRTTMGTSGGGSWTIAENFRSDHADITYGTSKMSAKQILLKTLQGSPIALTKENPDGEGRVADPEATLEAQQKAAELQKAFEEWIWQNPDRRKRLEERYNDTHNAMRPRVFDGSHQTFPGMSAKWQKQLRPHQRDAIYRTVADGTALLAHEVGFGKSAAMIAAAMEQRRLGLANKPVFVVPKATHEQFVSQFMEVYPGARLLVPEPSDFQAANRGAMLNRIATGDWDGVILSYEQFEKIPLSPATEARWIERQLAELTGSLLESGAIPGGKYDPSQKQIDKKIENYKVRLKQLRDKMASRSDDTRTFEELGIDQLYVDEADNYKNLPYVSRMASGRTGVKGLPQSEAQRSWDMYMKIRHLQEKSGQKPDGSFAKGGVVFATGTPVANTIAETYTMMRYLQPDELKRRGLESFDAWAKTYGHVKSGMEYTAGGKYKTVQRFSRFVNLPELSNLFQNVADIRVASEVPEMLEAQPRLVDGKGQPRRITVVAPSHPALEDYMAHVIKRVDWLGTTPPHIDNMLKISSDARKAAMDVQMVDPSAPYNRRGKVALAAENIARIYDEEAERKGTQLVFLDMGTPKETKDKGGDDTIRADEEELTGDESKLLTNVYSRLRTDLVRQGVPADQVAFIHEHDTPAARQEILDKVKDGEVRVLIGSTQKLGVGVNVQDRAAALHHIDVPWRPRDVEQREGRVIRQGNEVYGPEVDDEGNVTAPGPGVRVYQYVQENSFDRFMWQAVEEKARGIKALMKRQQTQREMDDVDPFIIGASEAKALASGNPLAIRAEEVRQKVDMGRLGKAAHKRRRYEAESKKESLGPRIESYRADLPALEADAKRVDVMPARMDFAIEVEGQEYGKRSEAVEPLAAAFVEAVRDPDAEGYVPIGKYRGFNVAMNAENLAPTIIHPETGQPHEAVGEWHEFWDGDVSPQGLMARLDNLVKGLPDRAARMRENLETAEQSVRLYDEQLAQPFEGAQELEHAERQLRVIQSRLSNDSTILREGDDPKMDVETDWEQAMASIAAPVKTPADTPREIPDAGPVDLREAVAVDRTPEEADTPAEVTDALEEELEAKPDIEETQQTIDPPQEAADDARPADDIPVPVREPVGTDAQPLDAEPDKATADQVERIRALAEINPSRFATRMVREIGDMGQADAQTAIDELTEIIEDTENPAKLEALKALDAPEPAESRQPDETADKNRARIDGERRKDEPETPSTPKNQEEPEGAPVGAAEQVAAQATPRQEETEPPADKPDKGRLIPTRDDAGRVKWVAEPVAEAESPTTGRDVIERIRNERLEREQAEAEARPEQTAAELIEAAKDGPVPLTGPGSIMEKLAEEEEAKRREAKPKTEPEKPRTPKLDDVDSAADLVLDKLKENRAFQNALANSDAQNAKVEYHKALERAALDLLNEGHLDIFRWFSDNINKFRSRLDFALQTRQVFATEESPKAEATPEVEPELATSAEPKPEAEPATPAAPEPFEEAERATPQEVARLRDLAAILRDEPPGHAGRMYAEFEADRVDSVGREQVQEAIEYLTEIIHQTRSKAKIEALRALDEPTEPKTAPEPPERPTPPVRAPAKKPKREVVEPSYEPTVLRNPAGSFSLVGKVPIGLVYTMADGSPLTPEVEKTIRVAGPGFARGKVKSVTFPDATSAREAYRLAVGKPPAVAAAAVDEPKPAADKEPVVRAAPPESDKPKPKRERRSKAKKELAMANTPKLKPASLVVLEGEPLYQGHKGPGIGYLKPDLPERRDGDGDTVVAERRPRKADEYEKSPLAMPTPSTRGRSRPKRLKRSPRAPRVRVLAR